MRYRLLPSALLLLAIGAPRAEAQERTAPQPDTVSEADSLGISPRGAFLRSLVLPGWGQAYVGAPGRGALYFALEAGSLWMTYKSGRELRAARRLERWHHHSGQLKEADALPLAEARAAQLEDWITMSVFLLLFSGADAYVAAQLADFDQRVGVRPGPDGAMRLEARLPVGGRK